MGNSGKKKSLFTEHLLDEIWCIKFTASVDEKFVSIEFCKFYNIKTGGRYLRASIYNDIKNFKHRSKQGISHWRL